MNLPIVYVANELNKTLRQGHPWVYGDQVSRKPHLPSGTWVQVQCATFRAYGLWDATSPIAVRIFSREKVPDARWVAERVRRAWRMREPLRQRYITAYRWLYGEGDGLPGIVADLYDEYVVLQCYAESVASLLPWVVEGLKACTPLKGILVRGEGAEPQVYWGSGPQEAVVVQENGLLMRANLLAGQKTGLFLDQRENRRYIEPWCGGKRVLNCFAYTGAFSLYAIRGGAREVVGADIAPQVAEETQRNLALNGFDPGRHPFHVVDCFALLDEYARQKERFDLIILDPPSLAQAKKSKFAALRAYARLNQAAMSCLLPGGLLATASCTSQVSPSDFDRMLGEAAARAGKRLFVLHEAGHALDHPVPAHFPEGRYLKFVLGRVEMAW